MGEYLPKQVRPVWIPGYNLYSGAAMIIAQAIIANPLVVSHPGCGTANKSPTTSPPVGPGC